MAQEQTYQSASTTFSFDENGSLTGCTINGTAATQNEDGSWSIPAMAEFRAIWGN